jgi:hypothetical protein
MYAIFSVRQRQVTDYLSLPDVFFTAVTAATHLH